MYLELALLFLLVLVYFIIRDRKPPNMPPGPFEIPFIGGMPFTDEVTAGKLKMKYGDIVTTRTGNMRSVYLFDYRTAKEALARPEFAGRPKYFGTFSLDDQKTGGVVSSIGSQWVHDRRFVLRNLRNLGMGKSYLEEAINTEAQALVEDLKKYEGKPIHFPDSFRTAVLNIIWQMVASRRYDLRSTEVDALYKLSNELQNLPIWTFLPLFIPILNSLFPKPIRNAIFKENVVDKFLDESKNLLQSVIDEHEKEFDSDNPVDLIDEYLKEMKEQEGNEESLLRKGALLSIINDLFSAGSDTLYNMLKWVAFMLARYPAMADKLQKEIEDAVGCSRIISIGDKPNLPFVEAFTVECLRYSSMILQNVEHTSLEDTTIAGYFIPKDTIVIVSNYWVHFDPRYWNEPEKFSPERFINEDGKFQQPREGFFAFGSGRRLCVGESLARMELFLFTAAIIQNFNIKVPDGVTLTDDFSNNLGLRTPLDTTLIYEARI